MKESILYDQILKDEAAREKQKHRRKNRKFLQFMRNHATILTWFFGLLILFGISAKPFYLQWSYQKAEQLIAVEEYVHAVEYLERIQEEHYLDAEDLLILCNSHICYEQGRIESAYNYYRELKIGIHLEHQTDEQKRAIAAYEAELETAYQPIAKEKERQKQEEQEKYLQKIASGFPFVGMSESYIAKTVLGPPSPKLRGNTEIINGKRYHATIYDFLENGRVVFTARCIQGKVTNVWDKRGDSVSVNDRTYQFTTDTDPYNASAYRTAEAFYDANYYEFFCFEDAESYYYKHRND